MTEESDKFLNQIERDELKNIHRQERDKKLCDRIKAIILLDAGWSYEKIAEVLLLDETSIRRYKQVFLKSGKEALTQIKCTGKLCELNQEQINELEKYVEKEIPTSSHQIVDYIKQEFNIEYCSSSVIKLLRRLNFIYKKPKLIPGKIDPEKQEKFLKELQEEENELGENDVVLYADAVHPQHNSKPAYGWIRKGSKETLKSNTGRERVNINAALNADDIEIVSNFCETVNAQSTVKLFKDIENNYPNAKKIIVICDNARYYYNKLVKEYLKSSRITLKFLPPYSPNLNLIERLWRFMNKKVRDNKYYEKFQKFKNAITQFFEKIPVYADELKTLLTKNFHITKEVF